MELNVHFPNRSGKILRGMVHRPAILKSASGRVPGVVFFHGFTGDRMESHWMFVKCSRALARAGIASLRFDFYGSGESDGEFPEITLRGEISDALAAVEFFRRQKGIDSRRLGLVGLSLGGAIAASLAARVGAQALVLWAALADPSELRQLAEKWARPASGKTGAREYNAHEVSPRFLKNISTVDPLKAIARFEGPTLIIHPGNDEYLSPAHPENYFLAAGAKIKEKVIVAGADHTFASIAWEGEVISRTVEWFRKYLAGEGRTLRRAHSRP